MVASQGVIVPDHPMIETGGNGEKMEDHYGKDHGSLELKKYDIGRIRDKLEPTEMIKHQIERCMIKMAEVDIDGFANAVEGLIIYCEALFDKEFEEDIQKLKIKLSTIFKLKKDEGGKIKMEDHDKYKFQNYKSRFRSCMKLIQRKNMLFKQEIGEEI